LISNSNKNKLYQINFDKLSQTQNVLDYKFHCFTTLLRHAFLEIYALGDNSNDDTKIKHLVMTIKELNCSAQSCLIHLNIYIPLVENVLKSSVVDLVPMITPGNGLPLLKLPDSPIKPNDFGDLYLEGLKLTGINLGYVVFYPCLYCSNKIIGTVNPLSSHIFKEAVWYFITFKIFF